MAQFRTIVGNPVSGRGAGIEPPSRWGAFGALLTCALLLALFAVVSWAAVSRKSATADEPVHVVAGWMHLTRGDFRVNPDDPPLWKFTAARPNAAASLPLERGPTPWQRGLADAAAWGRWCRAVLYSPSVEPSADVILARSRAVMLGWAVALGALVGWWAWKIGGTVAAIVAVALFSLDPNFIAHGPLVNGDVALGFVMLAAVYAAWRVGRRVTFVRLLLLALLTAAALAVKFSGVFVITTVCVIVMARVLVPAAWPLFGGRLRRWWGRPAVALIVLLVVASASFGGVWACYGFRFRPAHEPDARLDFTALATEAATKESRLRHPANKRLATQPLAQPSPVIRLATFAESRRLLPQAWVFGALHSYQSKLVQPAFLLGKLNRRGWWYYFPIAIAIKTPLATLVAVWLALWVLIDAWHRARPISEAAVWTATCLTLSLVVYLAAAMLTRMHQGLRHVLPVYPLLFIAVGVAAAIAWRRRRAAVGWVIALLAMGLVTETARAFPHYIPFFNAAAASVRDPLLLLSESNLDWGQDLPLLAKWQRQHPDRRLYLSYFGTADPAHHGVKAIDVRERQLDVKPQWPNETGAVLAVSATHLQGIAVEPEARRLYATLRDRQPLAVLGRSIYLYELPVK